MLIAALGISIMLISGGYAQLRPEEATAQKELRVTVIGTVELKLEKAIKGKDYEIRGDRVTSLRGEPLMYDLVFETYRIRKRFIVVREARDENGKVITQMQGKHLEALAKTMGEVDRFEGREGKFAGTLKDHESMAISSIAEIPPVPGGTACGCKAPGAEESGSDGNTEGIAKGTMSKNFTTHSSCLVIYLEGNYTPFYVLHKDFSAWDGHALLGKRVTITYKESRVDPEDMYTVSVVTSLKGYAR